MLAQYLQYLLHIDTYLINVVSEYGSFAYFLLFLIIFAETGLVVAPFLPGDSLLFAAGSIAANTRESFSIQLLLVSLIIAAILGNKVNYLIGRYLGPRVFHSERSWLLNKKYLHEAHQFYQKHGGKTIIFARFLPIIRTFVPFVAGAGAMNLRVFSIYNIISGVLWVSSLLAAGYYFGSIPLVREHFSLVVYAIIGISLIPVVTTVVCKSRR